MIAVVAGLAAQEALGSVVSGVMILAFKPFKMGDVAVSYTHLDVYKRQVQEQSHIADERCQRRTRAAHPRDEQGVQTNVNNRGERRGQKGRDRLLFQQVHAFLEAGQAIEARDVYKRQVYVTRFVEVRGKIVLGHVLVADVLEQYVRVYISGLLGDGDVYKRQRCTFSGRFPRTARAPAA